MAAPSSDGGPFLIAIVELGNLQPPSARPPPWLLTVLVPIYWTRHRRRAADSRSIASDAPPFRDNMRHTVERLPQRETLGCQRPLGGGC